MNMGCSHVVLSELKLNRFLPTGEDPTLFVTSQWGRGDRPLWYIVYRVTTAVLFPIWVSMDCVTEYREFYPNQPGVWFIFATNWSFMLLAAVTVFHAFIVLHYHYLRSNSHRTTDKMPASYSAFWIFYNVSANSALIVTISFWIFMSLLMTQDYMSSTMSELKHSLSGVYVLIDLLITSTPVRFLHFIYPIILGLTYTAFNAVYFLNGGNGPNGEPYTYYVLNWQKPGQAMTTTVFETILTIGTQLLLFLIYKLRVFTYNKLYKDCSLCGSCRDEQEELSLLNKKENIENDPLSYDSSKTNDWSGVATN